MLAIYSAACVKTSFQTKMNRKGSYKTDSGKITSFPRSAWERPSSTLCVVPLLAEARKDAERPVSVFPRRAWEQEGQAGRLPR
jgi:hypothetical protein